MLLDLEHLLLNLQVPLLATTSFRPLLVLAVTVWSWSR
jgi:hypothetical protein